MKFVTTTLVLFVISLTSVTAGFAQRSRLQSLRPIGEIKKAGDAVVFSSADALSDGNGVYIRWRTETETGNVGFAVYRLDKDGRQLVENKFIPGSAVKYRDETVYGEEYSIFDPEGVPTSQYVIESIVRDGRITASGPVFVTHVSDLAPAAGMSTATLFQRAYTATGRITGSILNYDKELQDLISDNTQLADTTTQRWVASQPGVKLGIKKTGMYRVTRAQLQAAGFDVNSDPAFWQVYTDGVEQAVLVGPNGDYVDFYARGIDTVEADTRMYYLVVGPNPGKRMSNVGFRPSVSTVRATGYQQSVIYKERTSYLLDIFNGEADNFVGQLIALGGGTANVNLSAVDPSAFSAHISVRILGYSTTVHNMNVQVNGVLVGTATGTIGKGAIVTLDADFPASLLVSGNNAIRFASTDINDYGFFDSLEISYKRRHVSDQNQIAFTTQNYRGARLEGFSSANIRVFDTTFDGSPALMTGAAILPNGGTFDVSIPAHRSRAMLAVEDSGLLTPAVITANSPSTLSNASHNGQLVIIAYRDFLPQANTWANYRRGQGTSVEVVDVEDVFDEFNFGVFSANSIRDFLNYARSVWQTPPQYVLLIGDGSYDPRNYEGTGYWDLVPAKLVDTVISETASDDALVDFNNDGLAEMAIGRIPARSSAMVTNNYNKTVAFETLSSTQNLSRGVLFAYDNPIGWNFQLMSEMMRDQLPAGTPNVLVPRADQNPNAQLIVGLNNAPYLVNFNGHGTAGSWASQANFANAHVPLLTNANPSVYTMLTCLTGYFPNTSFESMSERLLNSTTGGAVAAWASSGETTPNIQQQMGIRFYHQVGVGQITRLGDLVVDAKTIITAGRDVKLSWVLLGDPMLKMR
jgi:hypothetical protein